VANTIAIKSSDTAGATPVTLASGELALNRADNELYSLDESDNIVSIVAIDCGEIVA
jgi:DNA-binding beta-propeller fold protein YncE